MRQTAFDLKDVRRCRASRRACYNFAVSLPQAEKSPCQADARRGGCLSLRRHFSCTYPSLSTRPSGDHTWLQANFLDSSSPSWGAKGCWLSRGAGLDSSQATAYWRSMGRPSATFATGMQFWPTLKLDVHNDGRLPGMSGDCNWSRPSTGSHGATCMWKIEPGQVWACFWPHSLSVSSSPFAGLMIRLPESG